MNRERKLTKHQMKGDKLVATTFRATEYVQKNQTPFVIGVVAIMVVLTAVLFFRWSGNKKKMEAASMLSRAEMAAAVGQLDTYLNDLRMLVDNYGGTPTARPAALRLADALFQNQQYDDARKYYDKIVDDYSDDKVLAASAAAGSGACLALKGDNAGAAKMYKKAADFQPGDIWVPGFLLKAGEYYSKAGDKKSAEAALKEIEAKYPNASEMNDARRMLAQLQYNG